jgi:hypothetical protein
MANFLFVYRQDPARSGQMTPDARQQHTQKWQAWMNEGLQKGWLVQVGDGLKPQGRVVNGAKLITDGPFVESKEIVGGYSLVQADGLDEAAEIAQGSPCLLIGGTVEVRPLMGFVLNSEK